MKSPILSAPCLLATAAGLLISTSHGFQGVNLQSRKSTSLSMAQDQQNNSNNDSRRSFLTSLPAIGLGLTSILTTATTMPASAAIDVSGLTKDSSKGNAELAQQLRAFDGSASGRINQLKEIAPVIKPSASPLAIGEGAANAAIEEQLPNIGTWLYRASPGFNPRLSRAGTFGNLYKYEDQVVAPKSIKANALSISFEFPLDWLQLEKFLGGISYVDQRNGDRLWLLRTKLPEGERLATVNKALLGKAIFDPRGTVVKSGGIDIDDYKVASATTLNECPDNFCATHKRFKVKYATVTGNGLRVERRALVDAYEVSEQGDVYMLMTTSNAIKYDAKDSPQKATVEAIADSFTIVI